MWSSSTIGELGAECARHSDTAHFQHRARIDFSTHSNNISTTKNLKIRNNPKSCLCCYARVLITLLLLACFHHRSIHGGCRALSGSALRPFSPLFRLRMAGGCLEFSFPFPSPPPPFAAHLSAETASVPLSPRVGLPLAHRLHSTMHSAGCSGGHSGWELR